ncbi:MAG TPA: hypothetical protein ENK74_06335, partial [Nitratifractor sp.]|nr:hypothetical protein [Nitratifractor sp.]
MKFSKSSITKALAFVVVSSSLLYGSGSLVTDKIGFSKIVSTETMNSTNSLIGVQEGKLVKYSLDIENKSNLVLKDIKIDAKSSVECPKDILLAGESMECNYIAPLNDNSTIKLNGKLSNTAAVNEVEVQNGDFEDAELGWTTDGKIDFDSIGNSGLAAVLNSGASMSQAVAIESEKLYKVSFGTLVLSDSKELANVSIAYLDKEQKAIKSYSAKRVLEKIPFFNDLSQYVLMLPKAPAKAKYIGFNVESKGAKVAIDNVKVEEASIANRGYTVTKVLSGKRVANSKMQALCHPGIDIEKYTNNVDADTGTGPSVAVGSTVTWKYVVKNTGDMQLKCVTVEDNKEGKISCPKNVLEVGETMTCYKTGKAISGQYSNEATAKGKDKYDHCVSDKDPSHYHGQMAWTCPSGYTKFENSGDGVRMWDGATTMQDISSEFAGKLNGPKSVVIKDAYTWDGYTNRKYTTGQNHEQVRVVFVDSGNQKHNSAYTQDVADGVDYAQRITDLGTVNLPNGANKVIVAHISNDTYGSGDHSSPNSVSFKG